MSRIGLAELVLGKFNLLFPLISFVLITTFTPGPSNISSASMGVLHGYKNTLNYLLGLAGGFFLVMLLESGEFA